jgi:uncharacterized protein YndB with AHSA1/START domain
MHQYVVEPIVQVAFVQLSQAKTFNYFTSRFGDWWPRDYTFSKGVLDRICLGRAVGEWCYEQGPQGFRCDWGRILELNPPSLIAFTWQIGPKSVPQPDPSLCSEVKVEFAEATPGVSRVALTHKYFERHGADGASYRAELASDYGWPMLLRAFTAAAQD